MERFLAFIVLVLVMGGATLYSQQPPPPEGKAAPRSDNESSSKETKVNLSPPAGEPGYAPGKEPADDVNEMTPWDPMKADKNVEIGTYYMKLKNYAAAISRFREALYWKKDDAVAQFRLGQALEATGQYGEARKNFEAYVKTLPEGELAPLARKSLERMKGKADKAKKPGLQAPGNKPD